MAAIEADGDWHVSTEGEAFRKRYWQQQQEQPRPKPQPQPQNVIVTARFNNHTHHPNNQTGGDAFVTDYGYGRKSG
jgi:hypothetical protein